MKTTEEQITYLGKNNFVKFPNADQHNILSATLRSFLKDKGVLSDRKNFPFVVCDGKLQPHPDNSQLIIFGKGVLDLPFCIDTANGERIVAFNPDGTTRIVNSSLQNYIACNFQLAYYYDTIEQKKKLGDYDKNHEKYAAKLREMLNEAESGIENYPAWEMTIVEKELGVM